jgi:hypothetical protein
MTAPQIEFAYPVDWPAAKPRTPAHKRKEALFRSDGRRVLWDTALGRLREQVAMVTPNHRAWRMRELTLSTNHELRADGRPRRDRGAPSDPGVAFFFELDGQPHVLACDRWDTVADNIAAIAAHIEALRGQERWGVADMRQAFAGHVALPAPEQWWQVLGVAETASPAEINAAYRRLAATAHPDTGGSDAAMARLNAARDDGLRRAAGA